MNFVIASPARILTIGVTALLVACGGGGGGSGGDSTGDTPPATTASTVTTSNAQDVSAHAVVATENLIKQVGDGADVVTGISIDTASAGLVDLSLRQLYRALRMPSASNLAVGVTTSETVPCTGGGSAFITVNFASSTTLSAGDTIAITASNCVEDGMTNNGKMNIAINSVSGMPGETSTWGAAMAITFTDFRTLIANETIAATGNMAITVNQTSNNAASYVVTGNTMMLSTTKNGSTHVQTLNNYSFTGSETADAATYNVNFTLTGNLAKLGDATFTVKTITDFKQQEEDFPHQGAMKITGADNTSATVTAVGNGNVTIGLDKNADGVMEETINTTWTALAARI